MSVLTARAGLGLVYSDSKLTSETMDPFRHFDRTPWKGGDRPDARPVPTHRTAQRRNMWTHIHASGGIRIYDPMICRTSDINVGMYLYESDEQDVLIQFHTYTFVLRHSKCTIKKQRVS
jgi:hypothetical protein